MPKIKLVNSCTVLLINFFSLVTPPTVITDINQNGYRKIVSIVDVSGRKIKGTEKNTHSNMMLTE